MSTQQTHKGISKFKLMEGQKFNSITIIKYLGMRATSSGKKKYPWVLVKCDCQEEFETRAHQLPNNPRTCKACGFVTRRKVAVGDRFDKLVIVGFSRQSYTANSNRVKVRKVGRAQALKATVAHCKCDCGSDYSIVITSLAKNTTNSCGCAPNGAWKGYGRLSGTAYYRIVRNAEVRNIPFNLTIDFLWRLYENQKGLCALSSIPIDFGRLQRDETTASLDRIDSKSDYREGNVQWVHKDVNLMKMDHTEERLIYLCQKIVEKHNLKSLVGAQVMPTPAIGQFTLS